jgi:XTP/dITP diphosphohydrolase
VSGRQLVLASNNAHKVAEVGAILAPLGITVRPLADFPEIPEPPETGDTFEDNALQKARFVFARTGLPTVADDSGLAVDALGGAPGVRSKRFSPEARADTNNALLLEKLAGVEGRRARFVCALALVTDAGEAVVRGEVEGDIGHALTGEGGFGYDPLFWPLEAPGRSMAQLSPDEKNAISHRGRAFRQLPGLLSKLR